MHVPLCARSHSAALSRLEGLIGACRSRPPLPVFGDEFAPTPADLSRRVFEATTEPAAQALYPP